MGDTMVSECIFFTVYEFNKDTVHTETLFDTEVVEQTHIIEFITLNIAWKVEGGYSSGHYIHCVYH